MAIYVVPVMARVIATITHILTRSVFWIRIVRRAIPGIPGDIAINENAFTRYAIKWLPRSVRHFIGSCPPCRYRKKKQLLPVKNDHSITCPISGAASSAPRPGTNSWSAAPGSTPSRRQSGPWSWSSSAWGPSSGPGYS